MSDSESDWLPLEITTSKGPDKPSLATMPLPPTTTHTIETPTKMHSMPNASSSASTDSTSSDPADGEYNVLIQSLEDEETVPLTQQVEKAMKRTMSGTYIDDNMDGVYGNPLLPEVAAERMPPQEGGLIWNCSIIPDDYFSGGKLKRGLNARDFDHERQTIRPRRPSQPASNSITSLTDLCAGNGGACECGMTGNGNIITMDRFYGDNNDEQVMGCGGAFQLTGASWNTQWGGTLSETGPQASIMNTIGLTFSQSASYDGWEGCCTICGLNLQLSGKLSSGWYCQKDFFSTGIWLRGKNT